MCGIYGILNHGSGGPDRGVVVRMGEVMRHRGPDDDGFFSDSELMFGMNRLAIIDVEGGHQPIANEDESVIAICNGEIYNFRSLRADLEQRGHTFRTGSDCEVIVHLYEEYGDGCVEHLSGMFALAIWDKRRRRLVLARDRLGIKPLYIYSRDGIFVFASELKSVLEVPGVTREIDPTALREYLALGYVPAPLCMIRGVEKLPAGEILVADRSGQSRTRYWQMPAGAPQSRTKAEWAAEIAAAVESSVVSQMVSDVPLGAFLSGGLDSSAVVAYMARNTSHSVKTYSIGFDTGTGGGYYNELPYARKVAELFGTDHHEIVVRPDITSLLPELLWHMDEPIADAAFITTYLVSKFARQDVTVILSGVGGDELFGGYRRYWSENLVRWYRHIPKGLRKSVLQKLAHRLPSDRHSRILDWSRLTKRFLISAELDPDERYEDFIRVFSATQIAEVLQSCVDARSPALAAAFSRATDTNPLQRLIEVDLMTQLPDDLLMLTDRMSMTTSLECRVPLLDDRLVDLAACMPAEMKVNGTQLKYALKESLRDVLPGEIIDRKKRGFGAPIGGWFKKELAGYLNTVLSEEAVKERGIFSWDAICDMKQAHSASREDHTDHLLSLVNLELWCRIYLDGESRHDMSEHIAAAGAR